MFNTLARRQMLLAEIEEAEGELSPELLERLTVSDDRVQEGVLDLLGLRETAQSNINAAKAEMQRLAEFVKSNERAMQRFDDTLKSVALRLGPITAGSHRISTRPSVGVVLSEGFTVGNKYGKWVPPVDGFYQPDKTALRKALEAGEVIEGASLDHRTNLVVK